MDSIVELVGFIFVLACYRGRASSWTTDDMTKASTALRERRMGLDAVVKLYSISKPTLRRHLLNLNKYANGSTLKHGRGMCLPHDFETELVEHVARLEKMLFGITRKDLMKLAYELTERNGLQHVFSRDKKSAGKDWFSSFIKQHGHHKVTLCGIKM